MKNRGLILFSCVVVAGLGLASWWAGHSLPANVQLPIHWNAHGEVDGYAGKWIALMLPPSFAAMMALILWAVGRAEPQREHLASSQGLFRTVWLGGLGLGVVIELMLLSAIFHWGLPPLSLLMGAVGLFFVAMGNQLGKTRPMYMVGIRTPWTLADPDVWTATHRLGGKLMVLAGALAGLGAPWRSGCTDAADPRRGYGRGQSRAGRLFLPALAAAEARPLVTSPQRRLGPMTIAPRTASFA